MPNEFVVATSLRSVGSEEKVRATVDQYGCPVGMDFFDWMSLIGRVYTMHLGTEDAPIDSTTSIDDALVWGLIDVPDGLTIAVLEASVHVVDFTTGTLAHMMVETDAKLRYTSGGTAYTLLNMNTGKANASGLAAYVGTDITSAAKGTGSREIARHVMSNDAKATQLADENNNWIWRPQRYIPVVEGEGSVLLHFGAATADVTGYGSLKVALL